MDMSISSSSPVYSNQTPLRLPDERMVVHKANKTECDADQGQSVANKSDKMTLEEVEEMTESLNGFMRMINTDIQFALHEETNRLMVQVIDMRNNEVIKEFPPHELLDTLAAISDHIGMLLDKKA